MTPASGTAPWWRPDRYAARRGHLQLRARMTKAIRRHFDAAGFMEVETPALQVSPGMEPHLKPFEVELLAPDGSRARRYLHTSPEFAMKKLLVAGEPLIFQLTHAFRNAEGSDHHQPEFTMLEWYRAGADYREIMADCEALMQDVARACGIPAYRRRDSVCDPFQGCERLTVAEAFRRHAGLDLASVWPGGGDAGDGSGALSDPAPDPAPLEALARAAGIRTDAGDGWDDLFFRIFLERIEPRLGQGRPTILMDYPPHMAALARLRPGPPDVAERFELYVCGVELANAFSELTDAKLQAARFRNDQAERRRLYGSEVPVDPDFLAALEHGMPAAAGIALGVDRLAMLAAGAARIEDVLWAPVAAP